MIDVGFIGDLYVFVLAGFLGYQVISRVSPLLHTPLMSATTPSRHLLVGSLVVAGRLNEVSTLLGSSRSPLNHQRGGGFSSTDRILKMSAPGAPARRETAKAPRRRPLTCAATCSTLLPVLRHPLRSWVAGAQPPQDARRRNGARRAGMLAGHHRLAAAPRHHRLPMNRRRSRPGDGDRRADGDLDPDDRRPQRTALSHSSALCSVADRHLRYYRHGAALGSVRVA